jgi:hypothetical protein
MTKRESEIRSYVAFMLHGAAGRLWQSLKLLVIICNTRDMKTASNEGY